MTTGIIDIKSPLPLPSLPIKGKHSVQIRCPYCNTRVLTVVRQRFCGLLSSVHTCPQCHQKIKRV